MKLDHRTLRAIGQDLETIGMLDFDLKLEGERCVVHGTVASSAAPEHLPAGGFKGVWKRLRNTEADVSSELAPVPLKRVYLSDDIDRLLVEGQSHRGDGPESPKKPPRPELHSVAEISPGARCLL